MTKEKLLDVIMVISALESWAYAQKAAFPDYLIEEVAQAVEALKEAILISHGANEMKEHSASINCWCNPVQDDVCKYLWIHNKTDINGKFEPDMNLSEQSQLVEDCEKRESKLTDWEREFIDSLAARLCRGNGFSDKQADRLLKIWERITS